MPTPNERRALLFVATIAALGLGVRAVRGHFAGRAAADGAERASVTDDAASAALDRQIGAVDSATAAKRARSGARSKARKPGPGARRGAPPAAYDTMGPLSRSDRRPVRSPAESQNPDVAADPLALYEARRLAVAGQNRAVQARIDAERAEVSRVERTALAAKASANGRPLAEPKSGPSRRVDVDTADPDELAALPWVGAGLASRIVSDRAIRGPFGSLAALQRVRGIGPGLAARIAPFVTFSRPDSRPPEVIRFRPVRVRPPRP